MGSIILSSAYSRRDCLGISLFAVFSHSGSRTRRVGVLTILSYEEAGFVHLSSDERSGLENFPHQICNGRREGLGIPIDEGRAASKSPH
jgi:hypothetical protein